MKMIILFPLLLKAIVKEIILENLSEYITEENLVVFKILTTYSILISLVNSDCVFIMTQ